MARWEHLKLKSAIWGARQWAMVGAAAAVVVGIVTGSVIGLAATPTTSTTAPPTTTTTLPPSTTTTVEPATTTTVEPATTTTLPLGAPSDGTFCGPQFFDQASQVALENDYGVRGIPFVCYFSAHALTWVVVVPGGPRTALGDPVCGESPAPSWCATNPPAGAGIAVEHCSASDAACLAGSGHDLSQFTFYPFPDPTAELGQPPPVGYFYQVDNGGACGPLSFDVANGEWIIQRSSEADALVAGTAPPFPPIPPSAPPYVMSTAVPLPASELAANHPVTCPVVPPGRINITGG